MSKKNPTNIAWAQSNIGPDIPFRAGGGTTLYVPKDRKKARPPKHRKGFKVRRKR
jgi:hypothetical protein